MPCVSKCCCCCSLKYGYFAYGVICLIFRVCIITTMLTSSSTLFDGRSSSYIRQQDLELIQSISGCYTGWFFCTSIALFIALKGIIQRRSILLYPYIVVLIFEIIFAIIVTIIEAVVISPWLILQLIIVGALNIYALICLISLYQHMKNNEKRHPILPPSAPYKDGFQII